LIVAGMKVAEADGKIQDNELKILLRVMDGASTRSKSAFVRKVAKIASDLEGLERSRAKDKRSLIRMTADLSDDLDNLPESDRMRYLGLLIVTAKEVATSTGGGWFGKRSLNDEEARAATGMIGAVAGGIDFNAIIDWVEAHGY
jgi:hypothetical protein